MLDVEKWFPAPASSLLSLSTRHFCILVLSQIVTHIGLSTEVCNPSWHGPASHPVYSVPISSCPPLQLLELCQVHICRPMCACSIAKCAGQGTHIAIRRIPVCILLGQRPYHKHIPRHTMEAATLLLPSIAEQQLLRVCNMHLRDIYELICGLRTSGELCHPILLFASRVVAKDRNKIGQQSAVKKGH